jgi:hypothetical protein
MVLQYWSGARDAPPLENIALIDPNHSFDEERYIDIGLSLRRQ